MLWKPPGSSGSRIRFTSLTVEGSGRPVTSRNDRAHVGVGPALAELNRLHHVVAVADLEVLHVHPAGAGVEVLVLDPPLAR